MEKYLCADEFLTSQFSFYSVIRVNFGFFLPPSTCVKGNADVNARSADPSGNILAQNETDLLTGPSSVDGDLCSRNKQTSGLLFS